MKDIPTPTTKRAPAKPLVTARSCLLDSLNLLYSSSYRRRSKRKSYYWFGCVSPQENNAHQMFVILLNLLHPLLVLDLPPLHLPRSHQPAPRLTHLAMKFRHCNNPQQHLRFHLYTQLSPFKDAIASPVWPHQLNLFCSIQCLSGITACTVANCLHKSRIFSGLLKHIWCDSQQSAANDLAECVDGPLDTVDYIWGRWWLITYLLDHRSISKIKCHKQSQFGNGWSQQDYDRCSISGDISQEQR